MAAPGPGLFKILKLFKVFPDPERRDSLNRPRTTVSYGLQVEENLVGVRMPIIPNHAPATN
jgi:hypothetical protein